LVAALAGASLAACAHRESRPLEVREAPSTRAQASQGDSSFGYLKGAPAPGRPQQVGLATWYGSSFAGKKTSNGERFDPSAMTAAHRTLPFNTWVEVRSVANGNVVRVRINDRGPFGDDRKVIDLSRRAAELLGFVRDGSSKVELRVVRGPE
jgi:rare lipoprotein A (peptidoglycan hydrolase)